MRRRFANSNENTLLPRKLKQRPNSMLTDDLGCLESYS